jgi:membrane fusion protein (multidrug efflux system)
MRRRWWRWLLWGILLLIVVAIAIWGVRKWIYSRHHESTDDAQVSGRLVPVLTRVAGYVAAVYVQDNDHVSGGQLLVQLEEPDLRLALEQAEAALVEAEAAAVGRAPRPGQAEAQVIQARGQVEALAAQVAAARATAERAERDLRRAEELAAQEIVSRQDLDAARAAAATARANLRAAVAQHEAALAAVSSAEAGARAAEARVEGARAAVAQARLELSYARIRAPEAGLVAKRTVDPGQYLMPGQPIMAIVADTGIYVTANLKETQVGRIRPGQPVEFSVDAYGGCRAEGRVESLSGATGAEFALLPPDNATGNFVKVVQRIPVRIQVTRGCGSERRLRPGMSVNVHVETSR